MDLEHRFTVPASVEKTWAAFNDPVLVAPCFPGATLISVDGDHFTGSAKIKLGPIALQYNGTGTYVERDEVALRAVIEAKGRDRRGNGTANATVTAQLQPDGEGTSVHVTTDLAVTGKPAQFGRGVMQDVSDKLLQQFVACLQTKLGSSEAPTVEATPTAEVPLASAVEAPATSAVEAPATSAVEAKHASAARVSPVSKRAATTAAKRAAAPSARRAAQPPSKKTAAPGAQPAPSPAGEARATAGSRTAQPAEPVLHDPVPQESPQATSQPPPRSTSQGNGAAAQAAHRPKAAAYSPASATAAEADVELNLLATIGPVILKRYALPIVGVVALIVGYLLGRRQRR